MFRIGTKNSLQRLLVPGVRARVIQPVVPQHRGLKLSANQMNAVKGSLYFMYHDANERQPIPFELSFQNQITAVKAINKDDVLKSPRHAVKHYRRLLIEMAKAENVDFDESAPENKYRAPILNSEVLVYKKSNGFANFYVDIVSRYAKALLAKGELEISVETLKKLVEDDEVFFHLGDAERLSQCCRLLAKITPSIEEKEKLYRRSIKMIQLTFSSIRLTDELMFESDSSRITDELIACLNDMAFSYGKEAIRDSKHKDQLLTRGLHIYLSNLKMLQHVQDSIRNHTKSQSNYPLFNCDEINLELTINDIKTHISEIMWAKGYKKNAVSWGEQVVDDIYHQHSTSKRANEILKHDLSNLTLMYRKIGNRVSQQRCEKLQKNLESFELNEDDWYTSFTNRITRIIYYKGPLGVIEKALLERFGPAIRVPEIEEYEDEDTE